MDALPSPEQYRPDESTDMILIFRFYGDSPIADNSRPVIERECSEEDRDSIVKELQDSGYELEAVL